MPSCSLNACRSAALSLAITSRSSAAVLHCRTCLIRSLQRGGGSSSGGVGGGGGKGWLLGPGSGTDLPHGNPRWLWGHPGRLALGRPPVSACGSSWRPPCPSAALRQTAQSSSATPGCRPDAETTAARHPPKPRLPEAQRHLWPALLPAGRSHAPANRSRLEGPCNEPAWPPAGVAHALGLLFNAHPQPQLCCSFTPSQIAMQNAFRGRTVIEKKGKSSASSAHATFTRPSGGRARCQSPWPCARCRAWRTPRGSHCPRPAS